jgi:hypothetical protein
MNATPDNIFERATTTLYTENSLFEVPQVSKSRPARMADIPVHRVSRA